MTLGPTLETGRLILRPPEQSDLDGFADFYADPHTMRFLGGKTQQRSEAFRAMCTYAGAFALTGISMFSVIEKASGEWIGRVGPWQPEGWPGTEIGWGILRSAEGHGFATEAAAATMDFAVDELGWTDIIHTIVDENVGSIAVAKRLGAKLIGPTRLPAPFDDLQINAWGQTADDWKSRRAALA